MTFEDTKNYLKNNIRQFDELLPNIRRPCDVILQLIQYMESLCNDEDAGKCAPTSEFIKELSDILSNLNEVLLSSGVTESEEKLLMCLADMCLNYSNVFCQIKTYDLDIFITLVQSKKTITDSIKLLQYLLHRFSRFDSCNLESKTSTLSRKYYDELKSFMERKGDHDASYDTNLAINDKNLQIKEN